MLNSKILTQGTIEEQARAWLVYLYSNSVDENAKQQFIQWLKVSTQHAKAYKTVELAWRDIPLANNATLPQNKVTWIKQFAQKHIKTITGLAVAASLILSVLSYQYGFYQTTEINTYTTNINQIQSIELPDGSQVILSAKSHISSEFSAQTRHISLHSGLVYFDVKPDKRIPFEVTVGDNKVTVVGTEFEIRKGSQEVSVSVTEGSVQLSNTETNTNLDTLLPGQRAITAHNGQLVSVSNFEPKQAGHWQQGRLVYVDEKLINIIEDTNRYRTVPIMIANDELKKMRFTISFATDDSSQLLSALTTLQNVDIRYVNNAVHIIKK